MKRILVTGNEGYIGRVLVPLLIKQGYEVTGLDWGIFQDVALIPIAEKARHQIRKDIRDVTKEDLSGIDAVIHLAALSNDPIGDLNPQATYDINYHASVRLAKLARGAGVKRFLYSSSCSLYGISDKEYVTEDTELSPQTPYAESKVYSESNISKLANEHFTPVYLRNATAFGVSPRMRLDLVVPNLVATGFIYGEIQMQSDGTPWRPLVHIFDISRAFLLLLEAEKETVHNRAFNVGHKDNNVQIRDIAEQVAEAIPNASVSFGSKTPADTRSYKVDFSRIYKLGFSPQYSIKDGVEEAYNIFKQVNLTEEDFRSDAYITIERYKQLINEGVLDNMLKVKNL